MTRTYRNDSTGPAQPIPLASRNRHAFCEELRRSRIAAAVTSILAASSLAHAQLANADGADDVPQSVVASSPASASAAAGATPTQAQDVVVASVGLQGAQLDEIVVNARIRQEKIEDVPIPVSAVGGEALGQHEDLSIQDFDKLTPNLLVNEPNARQTSIAIRGIGKNTANDALEPSVGVIIDGVASAYIAQAWGDFPDVDHIEVLRGPQGTLLGKNTTLGVVQIVSKAPSFDQSGQAQVGAGMGNDLDARLSATGPLIDGLLAYRVSFYGVKRNGPYEDIAPDHTSETFAELNRFGGKAQFLLTPSDNLRVRVIIDREQSAELIPWGEMPLIGDPTTYPNGVSRLAGSGLTYTARLTRSYFNGYTPLIGSWTDVENANSRPTRTNTGGASAQVDWTLGGATITSISAVRNALFDAKNDGIWSPFNITRNGAIITQNQTSEELRVNSAVGQKVDYTAGIYLLDSGINSCDRSLYYVDAGAFYATKAQYNALGTNAVGKELLEDSLNNLFIYTCTRPRTTSEAGFGQVNWHLTDKGTLTLGLRATHEDKSNAYEKFLVSNSSLASNIAAAYYTGATAAQLSAAQGVYSALTPSIGGVPLTKLSDTSYAWLFNPSYKLADGALIYFSASYGEKSGAVTFNTSALQPLLVKPERALDFELGTKLVLLQDKLVANLNVYHTEVRDYQQNVTVVDPTTTTGFRTYLGNAPKVTLQGVELDGSFSLNKVLSISASGAYNHAYYSSFGDAPCPADIAGETNSAGVAVGPYQCNFTGKQLPYAPKFSANVGPEVTLPIGRGLALHAYVNETFRSGANYAAGLSNYGWFGSYGILDAQIGVRSEDDKWGLDLVSKNLLNKRYVTDITTFTNQAAVAAYPGEPRYIGAEFSYKY